MVTTARPSNGELGALLWRASRDETEHRRLALERVAQAARFWPEEAAEVAESGRSLTELRSVGPWVAAQIHGWLESPPAAVEPDETRTGYLTFAQVRGALRDDPSWETTPHGDLQMHSTDSDGSLALPDMVAAARAAGRTFMAATDHSKSLQIAGGQDEEQLADQGRGSTRSTPCSPTTTSRSASCVRSRWTSSWTGRATWTRRHSPASTWFWAPSTPSFA